MAVPRINSPTDDKKKKTKEETKSTTESGENTQTKEDKAVNTRRIVLLGKTGTGKSSLCNTLFGGNDTFKVNNSPRSITKFCHSETKTINGRSIQLIDTPGLFDTDLSRNELIPALLKCMVESAPGPHAFLLVLKMERFTKHERKVVDQILKLFSEDALKYTTVVFTHGDQLNKGQKIEEWVEENKSLKKLVDKCGGRCCVIDNKYWNNSQDPYRNNQNQIQQLLKIIDQTVRDNKGECYTNDFIQAFNQIVRENKGEYDMNKLLQVIQEIVTQGKKINTTNILQEYNKTEMENKGATNDFIQDVNQIVGENKGECNNNKRPKVIQKMVTQGKEFNITDNLQEYNKTGTENKGATNDQPPKNSEGSGYGKKILIGAGVGVGVGVGVVLGLFLGAVGAAVAGAKCGAVAGGVVGGVVGAVVGAVVGGAIGGVVAWNSQKTSEHPKSD